MQEFTEVTNSRMMLLNFPSLFICLSVTGMQIWHLKSFFENKAHLIPIPDLFTYSCDF
ncbi:putative GOLD domain-containing protein [Helianthus anomalus]